MAQSPYLREEAAELRVNASVNGSRRDLLLSDRAESLLVDDLDYGAGDLVPFAVLKALVLAGGASVPDAKSPRDTAWGLSGADGGREATAEDRYRTAEYLRSVEVDEAAVETLREHVRESGLSEFVADGEITSTADRVGNLSDIARDL